MGIGEGEDQAVVTGGIKWYTCFGFHLAVEGGGGKGGGSGGDQVAHMHSGGGSIGRTVKLSVAIYP